MAPLALLIVGLLPRAVLAQTPSPLEEWQYSSGIVLEKLFVPDIPEWRRVVGLAVDNKPVYDGSSLTRTQGGPVINIRYKDLAFVSVGEGLGVNLLRGHNYSIGLAMGYDLGRKVSDDVEHLHGLGDIGRSASFKAFASYAVAKSFPLVLRGDVRQMVGGADGMVADLGAYLPLPGSSRHLIMFAGPSVTYADHRYMQREFGVTEQQSLASGYHRFEAQSGINEAGIGFSATGFLTKHWLLNVDAAVNHMLNSARDSPITTLNTQRALAVSFDYQW